MPAKKTAKAPKVALKEEDSLPSGPRSTGFKIFERFANRFGVGTAVAVLVGLLALLGAGWLAWSYIDNKDGADSLEIMLRIMGNDIRIAYDGQEGVELADEFRPDVALLDIGLPNLNGYEACRHIRERTWGKEIVVIAMTGWGREEDRRRSHEAGFDHQMVKPVDPSSLMKLLAGLSDAVEKEPS